MWPQNTGDEMTAFSRKRTFEVLDIGRPHDQASRVADVVLIGLISINVLAVILESIPEMAQRWHAEFYALEIFSVVVFSVEYLARLWSCAEDPERDFSSPVLGRLRYMLTPMALIDLIAILPFYLGFFVTADLRFMRVLRLLRIFKLTRYSSSMSLLLEVLKDEVKSIGAALFVLMLLIVLAASFTYLAEHQAQPQAFGSIPAAMWWTVITMTTVGYGDVVPVTVLGKFFGATIGIMGVGMVALPAGLLASGFSGALRRRRIEYEELVQDALEDGQIEDHEEEALEASRAELGISAEEAELILGAGLRKSGVRIGVCPHCQKSLYTRRQSDRSGERRDSDEPAPDTTP